MKRGGLILGILIGGLLASVLFAFVSRSQVSGGVGSDGGVQREIKVAHSLPTDHPVHQGIVYFSERLSALSGGQMECTVFPNGQMGKETTYLEKLQSGSLDVAKTSAAPIASFVPRMKVFSFPYLFRDREHYWSVLDGETGVGLLEKLADRGEGKASGFLGLCYYDAGSRNFYTVDPVKKPDDLRGKTIRVMQDPVAIAMMQELGATPKPMGGGEIYGALQRGVIDGAENNPPTFVAQRHYEVCKHFTFDHHSRIPDVLLISSALWDKLSDREKEWVRTAARESSRYQRRLWQEKSDAAVEVMKKEGVTIYQPDVADFEEAAGGAGAALQTPEVRDLMKKIRETH